MGNYITVKTGQGSIVVTIDAFDLAAILVREGQANGLIPNCFAPREDLRVMDVDWDNGSLTFALAVQS